MEIKNKISAILGIVLAIALFTSFVIAVPTGPISINVTGNSTKNITSGMELNVSGGYIAYLNVSASVQNPRWKAFVGSVTGKFTLSDSAGSAIYDWTLATVAGRVYSTRNSSSVSWTTVQCANTTLTEWENYQLNHTSPYDNITATFDTTTHDAFYVGAVNLSANSCPSLATFVNNAAQSSVFQEVVLTDSTSPTSKLIYSTKLEGQIAGFDNNLYDFQMIVPEIGLVGNSVVTPYYLYVELS